MQPRRTIRSFVLRAGRLTAGQQRALLELWPTFGIDEAQTALDLDFVFGRAAPRCLEIGFGTGDVIAALAEAHPDVDYLGIEVHPPGVGRLLLRAEAAGLRNLRVIRADAVEALSRSIADRALDEVLIFFPDPWHKTRHAKRRLVDAAFVAMAAAKLRPGGILRLATDWQPYAEQMLRVCNADPALVNLSAERTFVARPEFRPTTRFERRGERLGHRVWDLAYRKCDGR